MNLYDTLGVDKNATADEIKQAFRDKVKENHTDKGGDNDKMVALNKAYSVLKSPQSRKRYDETGAQEDVPFDRKFQEIIQFAFLRIIDGTKNVETADLLASLNKFFNIQIGEHKKNKKALEGRVKKLEKVKERLIAKKDNKIGYVLQINLDEIKLQLGGIDEQIKFLGECKEVINHYEYKFDKEEPKEGVFVTWQAY